jgi:hypothetical protein
VVVWVEMQAERVIAVIVWGVEGAERLELGWMVCGLHVLAYKAIMSISNAAEQKKEKIRLTSKFHLYTRSTFCPPN